MKSSSIAAVLLAVKHGRLQTVSVLLSNGDVDLIDFDIPDSKGRTPFWHACHLNNLEMIRKWLSHLDSFDVGARDKDGVMPRDVCSPENRALDDRQFALHAANYKSLIADPKDIKYLDKKPVGEGGYGVVYPGVWKGQKVAVKYVREQVEEEGEASSRIKFEKEGNVWAVLGAHPNVLPLLAFTETPLMMICPFAEGGDLHGFLWKIRKEKAYFDIAYQLLLGISRGIKAMTDHFVVHGK